MHRLRAPDAFPSITSAIPATTIATAPITATRSSPFSTTALAAALAAAALAAAHASSITTAYVGHQYVRQPEHGRRRPPFLRVQRLLPR